MGYVSKTGCGLKAGCGSKTGYVSIADYGQFQVVFLSTCVRAGRVRVEFFQPVRVTCRVSVRVFFTILTLNPTLTRPVDTICQPT